MDFQIRSFMKLSMFPAKFVLVVVIALMCCGCGGSSSGLNDNKGGATLTLTANPTSVNADGISFSTITAVLTGSTGEPALQGTQVDFTTNIGLFANGANRFQTVTDAGTGTAIAILYAGTSPSDDVTVTCTAGGLTVIVKLKFISVLPGPVANITLAVSNPTIIADGISSSIITATLKDRNGTSVAIGTAVSFSTNLGVYTNNRNQIDTSTVDENGTATATLIAGLTPGTATITCTSGSVSAIIRIEIRSF
jgi:adhesin/invasin